LGSGFDVADLGFEFGDWSMGLGGFKVWGSGYKIGGFGHEFGSWTPSLVPQTLCPKIRTSNLWPQILSTKPYVPSQP